MLIQKIPMSFTIRTFWREREREREITLLSRQRERERERERERHVDTHLETPVVSKIFESLEDLQCTTTAFCAKSVKLWSLFWTRFVTLPLTSSEAFKWLISLIMCPFKLRIVVVWTLCSVRCTLRAA